MPEGSVRLHCLDNASLKGLQDKAIPQEAQKLPEQPNSCFYQFENDLLISDEHSNGLNDIASGNTAKGWSQFDSIFPDARTLFSDEPATAPLTMAPSVDWGAPLAASQYTPFYSGFEDQLQISGGQNNFWVGAADIVAEPEWLEDILEDVLGEDEAKQQTHATPYDSLQDPSAATYDGAPVNPQFAQDDGFEAIAEILAKHVQEHYGLPSHALQAPNPAEQPSPIMQALGFSQPAQMHKPQGYHAQKQKSARQQRPNTAPQCGLQTHYLGPQHMNMVGLRPQSAPRASIKQPYFGDFGSIAFQPAIASAA